MSSSPLLAAVGEIAFQNKAVVYAILFRAAAETLATIAADPQHLGAKLGMTMVLRYTWGQTLGHHPHVHCVVPGGVTLARRQPLGRLWPRLPSCRCSVLSRLFRRLFPAGTGERLRRRQALRFFGAQTRQPLAEPAGIQTSSWRVPPPRLGGLRAKPPFGGPGQVLAYLGRYTHRVAIANSRLLSLADGKVRFTWKDYRAGGKTKVDDPRCQRVHPPVPVAHIAG